MFPILASVLVLCAVIAWNVHRGKDQVAKEEEAFWERERAANNTRRKPLDNLNYISIPLSELPIGLHTDDEKIEEYVQTIKTLSESPIVNLTGFSNTDLKLEYGAPNITLLSQYDQRYTTLVGVLQRWATALYDLGEVDAARTILEFAISTGSDVSGSYKLLSSIYYKDNNIDAIKQLINQAETLNSAMKQPILEYLKAYLQ